MKIPVETYFDKETDQWCVGMVAPPWIASCGRTLGEAKEKFVEAFRAYFEPPKKVKARPRRRDAHIELVRVA